MRGFLKFADWLTVGNAIFGFAAILLFVKGQYLEGCISILFAGFLDFIDGRVARYLGHPTLFGKALDFADLISFGVAPAILTSMFVDNWIGYTSGIILVSATLLRLARFNVTDTPFSVGMPTTFSAIIFPFVYIIQNSFAVNPMIYPLASLVSAYFMLGSFHLHKV